MQQPNQVANQQLPRRGAALCDCMEVNEQLDAAQSSESLQLLSQKILPFFSPPCSHKATSGPILSQINPDCTLKFSHNAILIYL
jgi:hypothetical protein